MRMIEIEKGRVYADREGRERLVLGIGTNLRPPGYRQPYSGVEWCYVDDEDHPQRWLLSEFATASTHLVAR